MFYQAWLLDNYQEFCIWTWYELMKFWAAHLSFSMNEYFFSVYSWFRKTFIYQTSSSYLKSWLTRFLHLNFLHILCQEQCLPGSFKIVLLRNLWGCINIYEIFDLNWVMFCKLSEASITDRRHDKVLEEAKTGWRCMMVLMLQSRWRLQLAPNMNCLAALASVLSLATAILPLLTIYGISGSGESNNTFKIYRYLNIYGSQYFMAQ